MRIDTRKERAEIVDYLFPHFSSDPWEYEQAESLWRERWEDLLRRVGQEQLWQASWSNTSFVNGASMQDGNPIFSAICSQRKLAVRVIQLEPLDNPHEFSVWADTFAEGSPEAVKELVVSCVLTQESLDEAVERMRQWITEEKIQQPPQSPVGPCPPNPFGALSAPASDDKVGRNVCP